jgi:hypothetical protein
MARPWRSNGSALEGAVDRLRGAVGQPDQRLHVGVVEAVAQVDESHGALDYGRSVSR